MVKNRYCQLIMIAFCLVFLSSCASSYIGKSVIMLRISACETPSLPASCSSADKNFAYKYTIEKTGNPDEYKISGTAEYLGGLTFSSFSNVGFTLLLVEGGCVVESFGVVGGSGSLASKITFSRTFVTPLEFDATIFFCSGGNARG